MSARPDGVVPPPPEVAARYRARGHWRDVALDDHVLRHAASKATAVVAGDDRLTHGELAQRVDGAAAALHAAGIRSGERVLLRLSNSPALLTTMLGAVRIGAAPVLAVPALGEREVAHVARATAATAAVVDARLQRGRVLAATRELLAPAGPLRTVLVSTPGPPALGAVEFDDRLDGPAPQVARPAADGVAVYLLSSGTTGLPKPIPRTHQDYVYNLRISAAAAGVTRATVYLAALPVAHNFALGCPGVLGVLAAGGSVVLANAPTPATALQLIGRHRVDLTAAVPGMAVGWAEAAVVSPAELDSLAVVQVGGARLSPADASRIQQLLGCRVQQVYGMAEGLLNFTRLDDPEDVVVSTQGRPASPDDELRIVDEHGVDVGPGQSGELWTRGPYTIRGYLADAATNAASFTPDGYYRTGDVVRLHPSGNLVVEGRRKDFINRGGEKVSAHELEQLLTGHPAVAQVAAVAMPDRALGERVCLYAVPRSVPGPQLGQLRAFLTQQGVARFKLPDRLEIVDELPVNAVGKLDRRALRSDITQKLRAGGARTWPRTPTT